MEAISIHGHLSTAFKSFHKGLMNSTPARNWLKSQGIDPTLVLVGLNRGKFHKGRGKAYIEGLVEVGLLNRSGVKGRYRSFAKDFLLFPLFSQTNELINFYAIHPGRSPRQTILLNKNEGCYPRYPDKKTQEIFFGIDIPATAQMICKSKNQNGLFLLALDEGKMPERYLQLISELPYLKKVTVPLQVEKKQRELISEYIAQNRPNVELQFREPETFESKEVIHVSSKSESNMIQEKEFSFEIIHPALFLLKNNRLQIEVLGGINTKDSDRMDTTLKITSCANEKRSFRDTVNLYQHVQKSNLINEASDYLLEEANFMEQMLDHLVYHLEEYRLSKTTETIQITAEELTIDERQAAMDLLERPDLMHRIHHELLAGIGIVGEKMNRMIIFLVMTSRKLECPLHAVNYGSTGIGKSALMDAIAQCMPEEDYLELTSTSSKALFHFKEFGLQHKLLLIQDTFDLSHKVMYQIRELQSKRKLIHMVTIKDKDNGFQSILKTLYGPVCVIASSTADAIYADNANRSIEITLDESPEQDQRIVERQNQLAANIIELNQEKKNIALLKNMQRLLKTYPVINPFAPYLDIPLAIFKKRRNNAIYLGLIEVITLLNQHRRKRKTFPQGKEYLVSEIEDIEWANLLIENIFLRKSDPLSQAERLFLEDLKTWSTIQATNKFSQQQLVKGLRRHPSKVKRYLSQLLAHGHLQISGGDRYRSGFVYSISQDKEHDGLQQHIRQILSVSLQRARQVTLTSSLQPGQWSTSGPITK